MRRASPPPPSNQADRSNDDIAKAMMETRALVRAVFDAPRKMVLRRLLLQTNASVTPEPSTMTTTSSADHNNTNTTAGAHQRPPRAAKTATVNSIRLRHPAEYSDFVARSMRWLTQSAGNMAASVLTSSYVSLTSPKSSAKVLGELFGRSRTSGDIDPKQEQEQEQQAGGGAASSSPPAAASSGLEFSALWQRPLYETNVIVRVVNQLVEDYEASFRHLPLSAAPAGRHRHAPHQQQQHQQQQQQPASSAAATAGGGNTAEALQQQKRELREGGSPAHFVVTELWTSFNHALRHNAGVWSREEAQYYLPVTAALAACLVMEHELSLAEAEKLSSIFNECLRGVFRNFNSAASRSSQGGDGSGGVQTQQSSKKPSSNASDANALAADSESAAAATGGDAAHRQSTSASLLMLAGVCDSLRQRKARQQQQQQLQHQPQNERQPKQADDPRQSPKLASSSVMLGGLVPTTTTVSSASDSQVQPPLRSATALPASAATRIQLQAQQQHQIHLLHHDQHHHERQQQQSRSEQRMKDIRSLAHRLGRMSYATELSTLMTIRRERHVFQRLADAGGLSMKDRMGFTGRADESDDEDDAAEKAQRQRRRRRRRRGTEASNESHDEHGKSEAAVNDDEEDEEEEEEADEDDEFVQIETVCISAEQAALLEMERQQKQNHHRRHRHRERQRQQHQEQQPSAPHEAAASSSTRRPLSLEKSVALLQRELERFADHTASHLSVASTFSLAPVALMLCCINAVCNAGYSRFFALHHQRSGIVGGGATTAAASSSSSLTSPHPQQHHQRLSSSVPTAQHGGPAATASLLSGAAGAAATGHHHPGTSASASALSGGFVVVEALSQFALDAASRSDDDAVGPSLSPSAQTAAAIMERRAVTNTVLLLVGSTMHALVAGARGGEAGIMMSLAFERMRPVLQLCETALAPLPSQYYRRADSLLSGGSVMPSANPSSSGVGNIMMPQQQQQDNTNTRQSAVSSHGGDADDVVPSETPLMFRQYSPTEGEERQQQQHQQQKHESSSSAAGGGGGASTSIQQQQQSAPTQAPSTATTAVLAARHLLPGSRPILVALRLIAFVTIITNQNDVAIESSPEMVRAFGLLLPVVMQIFCRVTSSNLQLAAASTFAAAQAACLAHRCMSFLHVVLNSTSSVTAFLEKVHAPSSTVTTVATQLSAYDDHTVPVFASQLDGDGAETSLSVTKQQKKKNHSKSGHGEEQDVENEHGADAEEERSATIGDRLLSASAISESARMARRTLLSDAIVPAPVFDRFFVALAVRIAVASHVVVKTSSGSGFFDTSDNINSFNNNNNNNNGSGGGGGGDVKPPSSMYTQCRHDGQGSRLLCTRCLDVAPVSETERTITIRVMAACLEHAVSAAAPHWERVVQQQQQQQPHHHQQQQQHLNASSSLFSAISSSSSSSSSASSSAAQLVSACQSVQRSIKRIVLIGSRAPCDPVLVATFQCIVDNRSVLMWNNWAMLTSLLGDLFDYFRCAVSYLVTPGLHRPPASAIASLEAVMWSLRACRALVLAPIIPPPLLPLGQQLQATPSSSLRSAGSGAGASLSFSSRQHAAASSSSPAMSSQSVSIPSLPLLPPPAPTQQQHQQQQHHHGVADEGSNRLDGSGASLTAAVSAAAVIVGAVDASSFRRSSSPTVSATAAAGGGAAAGAGGPSVWTSVQAAAAAAATFVESHPSVIRGLKDMLSMLLLELDLESTLPRRVNTIAQVMKEQPSFAPVGMSAISVDSRQQRRQGGGDGAALTSTSNAPFAGASLVARSALSTDGRLSAVPKLDLTSLASSRTAAIPNIGEQQQQQQQQQREQPPPRIVSVPRLGGGDEGGPGKGSEQQRAAGPAQAGGGAAAAAAGPGRASSSSPAPTTVGNNTFRIRVQGCSTNFTNKLYDHAQVRQRVVYADELVRSEALLLAVSLIVAISGNGRCNFGALTSRAMRVLRQNIVDGITEKTRLKLLDHADASFDAPRLLPFLHILVPQPRFRAVVQTSPEPLGRGRYGVVYASHILGSSILAPDLAPTRTYSQQQPSNGAEAANNQQQQQQQQQQYHNPNLSFNSALCPTAGFEVSVVVKQAMLGSADTDRGAEAVDEEEDEHHQRHGSGGGGGGGADAASCVDHGHARYDHSLIKALREWTCLTRGWPYTARPLQLFNDGESLSICMEQFTCSLLAWRHSPPLLPQQRQHNQHQPQQQQQSGSGSDAVHLQSPASSQPLASGAAAPVSAATSVPLNTSSSSSTPLAPASVPLLTLESVLRTFAMACQTVRGLHERGIVHGDVKLANFVVRFAQPAAAPHEERRRHQHQQQQHSRHHRLHHHHHHNLHALPSHCVAIDFGEAEILRVNATTSDNRQAMPGSGLIDGSSGSDAGSHLSPLLFWGSAFSSSASLGGSAAASARHHHHQQHQHHAAEFLASFAASAASSSRHLLGAQRRMGTLVASAPEILRHEFHPLSCESDLPKRDTWALGCMLFEIITGDFMFKDEHEASHAMSCFLAAQRAGGGETNVAEEGVARQDARPPPLPPGAGASSSSATNATASWVSSSLSAAAAAAKRNSIFAVEAIASKVRRELKTALVAPEQGGPDSVSPSPTTPPVASSSTATIDNDTVVEAAIALVMTLMRDALAVDAGQRVAAAELADRVGDALAMLGDASAFPSPIFVRDPSCSRTTNSSTSSSPPSQNQTDSSSNNGTSRTSSFLTAHGPTGGGAAHSAESFQAMYSRLGQARLMITLDPNAATTQAAKQQQQQLGAPDGRAVAHDMLIPRGGAGARYVGPGVAYLQAPFDRPLALFVANCPPDPVTVPAPTAWRSSSAADTSPTSHHQLGDSWLDDGEPSFPFHRRTHEQPQHQQKQQKQQQQQQELQDNSDDASPQLVELVNSNAMPMSHSGAPPSGVDATGLVDVFLANNLRRRTLGSAVHQQHQNRRTPQEPRLHLGGASTSAPPAMAQSTTSSSIATVSGGVAADNSATVSALVAAADRDHRNRTSTLSSLVVLQSVSGRDCALGGLGRFVARASKRVAVLEANVFTERSLADVSLRMLFLQLLAAATWMQAQPGTCAVSSTRVLITWIMRTQVPVASLSSSVAGATPSHPRAGGAAAAVAGTAPPAASERGNNQNQNQQQRTIMQEIACRGNADLGLVLCALATFMRNGTHPLQLEELWRQGGYENVTNHAPLHDSNEFSSRDLRGGDGGAGDGGGGGGGGGPAPVILVRRQSHGNFGGRRAGGGRHSSFGTQNSSNSPVVPDGSGGLSAGIDAQRQHLQQQYNLQREQSASVSGFNYIGAAADDEEEDLRYTLPSVPSVAGAARRTSFRVARFPLTRMESILSINSFGDLAELTAVAEGADASADHHPASGAHRHHSPLPRRQSSIVAAAVAAAHASTRGGGGAVTTLSLAIIMCKLYMLRCASSSLNKTLFFMSTTASALAPSSLRQISGSSALLARSSSCSISLLASAALHTPLVLGHHFHHHHRHAPQQQQPREERFAFQCVCGRSAVIVVLHSNDASLAAAEHSSTAPAAGAAAVAASFSSLSNSNITSGSNRITAPRALLQERGRCSLLAECSSTVFLSPAAVEAFPREACAPTVELAAFARQYSDPPVFVHQSAPAPLAAVGAASASSSVFAPPPTPPPPPSPPTQAPHHAPPPSQQQSGKGVGAFRPGLPPPLTAAPSTSAAAAAAPGSRAGASSSSGVSGGGGRAREQHQHQHPPTAPPPHEQEEQLLDSSAGSSAAAAGRGCVAFTVLAAPRSAAAGAARQNAWWAMSENVTVVGMLSERMQNRPHRGAGAGNASSSSPAAAHQVALGFPLLCCAVCDMPMLWPSMAPATIVSATTGGGGGVAALAPAGNDASLSSDTLAPTANSADSDIARQALHDPLMADLASMMPPPAPDGQQQQQQEQRRTAGVPLFESIVVMTAIEAAFGTTLRDYRDTCTP